MKAKYLLIFFLLYYTKAKSQFLKNEKMTGGNLDPFIIREKIRVLSLPDPLATN